MLTSLALYVSSSLSFDSKPATRRSSFVRFCIACRSVFFAASKEPSRWKCCSRSLTCASSLSYCSERRVSRESAVTYESCSRSSRFCCAARATAASLATAERGEWCDADAERADAGDGAIVIIVSAAAPALTRTLTGPIAAASYVAGASAVYAPRADRGADIALRAPGGGIGFCGRPEYGGMLLGM